MADSSNVYISALIQKFLRYVSVIFLIFGILFSSLSFLVFIRKNLSAKKNMMGFYGIVQCVIDLVTHLLGFYYYFTISMGDDKQLHSDIFCKLKNFLVAWVVQLSSWLQVMITIDRIISVKYPNRFKILKDRRFLFMIVVALYASLSIANCLNFFYYIEDVTVQAINNSNSSLTIKEKICTSNRTIVFIRDLIGILLRTIVPFLITFVLNFLLIRCLIESKKKINKDKHLKKERQFAITIIALNCLFFVTQLPLGASLILLNVKQYAIIPTNTALIRLIFFVAVYIALLFNTLSFMVYLTSNKLFRKEFFQMFHVAKNNLRSSFSGTN
jgi:hypothetical protein